MTSSRLATTHVMLTGSWLLSRQFPVISCHLATTVQVTSTNLSRQQQLKVNTGQKSPVIFSYLATTVWEQLPKLRVGQLTVNHSAAVLAAMPGKALPLLVTS